MSGRLLRTVPAMLTGVNAAVVCFLAMGLASERVSKPMGDALLGRNGIVALLTCVVVLVGFAALVLRWTAVREASGRGLLLALAAAVGGFLLGAALFGVAHSYLPRPWFSRGGDWDIDPMMELALTAIVTATVAFWMVLGRKWRPAERAKFSSASRA